ncbi:MAG TPA: flagellar export protein FliJ [bacterium]|nr:flagellar export protein FliJ [bacterium]
MRKFKFRLEPVVSLKRKMEDERKMDLAVAKRDLEAKESHLVRLHEHKATCESQRDAWGHPGSLDVPGMLLYYAYMEKLTDEIADHTSRVERSRENVGEKRELLVKSSSEKKALEKLRAKMKQRHMVEAKREEQAILDDTASKFHGRKSHTRLLWSKE